MSKIIKKYQIPNGVISPGDEFSIEINSWYKFLCLTVENDAPVLYYIVDDEKPEIIIDFIYLQDASILNPEISYSFVGAYCTAVPANDFVIFQKF